MRSLHKRWILSTTFTQRNITNDITLQKNLIIIGPNASGKTTLIKSTILNLFLSEYWLWMLFLLQNQIYEHYHSYLNIQIRQIVMSFSGRSEKVWR